ncbi:hypothetical protein [Litoribrevibacter albus]|uniref:Uncharacterized protein n=1 Tax=Litoribrevibacter albus TaxID=1473156 RepID=A0AA37SBV7_9GAMM|nr:hypothetical protein [Litoribrevibacter albus]GLQ31638.1 hypothetical protein GCM10007876_21170 [Litoribrevibacter albus]
MNALNKIKGITTAPSEFNYSLSEKAGWRTVIEADVEAFLASGKKIKVYDNSGKVRMIGSWDASSAKKLSELGKQRRPDTPLSRIEFNNRAIRIFINPKGQAEYILKDVGLALGMMHSFPLRFASVKTTRKLRMNGVNRTLSTAQCDDIVSVVSKIPGDVVDVALRDYFVQWLVEQSTDQVA